MYEETSEDLRIYWQECLAKVNGKYVKIYEFHQDDSYDEDTDEYHNEGDPYFSYSKIGNGHSGTANFDYDVVDLMPVKLGWYNDKYSAFHIHRRLHVESPYRYRKGFNDHNVGINDISSRLKMRYDIEAHRSIMNIDTLKVIDEAQQYLLSPMDIYQDICTGKRLSGAFDNHAMYININYNRILLRGVHGDIAWFDDDGYVRPSSNANYPQLADLFENTGFEVKEAI